MGNVFINYRREETAGEARALFKELAETLGSDAVFMDVDSITLGRDFREIVGERLESCDLMLALVGRNWVAIKAASGRKRLEDPDDFVRLEIEAALKRGIPVIPVLVQGAQMPTIPTFDGVGRAQPFQGGIISWHPETGAHIVWGKIGERWLQIGREQFGYPITDEVAKPDGRGRASDFRAVHLPGKPVASIYWTPDTGAHEVLGAIHARWTEIGGERSPLGYPVSPESDHAGGRIQRFQGGSLFWTPQGGVVLQ